LASALVDRETLTADEIKKILSDVPQQDFLH